MADKDSWKLVFEDANTAIAKSYNSAMRWLRKKMSGQSEEAAASNNRPLLWWKNSRLLFYPSKNDNHIPRMNFMEVGRGFLVLSAAFFGIAVAAAAAAAAPARPRAEHTHEECFILQQSNDSFDKLRVQITLCLHRWHVAVLYTWGIISVRALSSPRYYLRLEYRPTLRGNYLVRKFSKRLPDMEILRDESSEPKVCH